MSGESQASMAEQPIDNVNSVAEDSARKENNAALISALNERAPSEVESSFVLDVINETEHGRWIATLGDDAIAEVSYRFVGG
jgi:hypothetical protein